MSIKRCLVRIDQNEYYHCFLCAACLPASLIMHITISKLQVQWHFSMNLNSQQFLQFYPTGHVGCLF